MSGQQLHPLSNAELLSGSMDPETSGSSSTYPTLNHGGESSGPNRLSAVDPHGHTSPRTLGSDHVNKGGPSTLKQSLHAQRGARPASELLKPNNYANPESKHSRTMLHLFYIFRNC
jgi:hypothetical protein